MDCGKHEKMVVMHIFSDGECIVCDKEIQTSHTPCNMVCPECSEKYELCEICGELVISEEEKEKHLEYFEDVKYRMGAEGFHYCFEGYSHWNEIKDVKFHELRKLYLDTAKKIEEYVDKKIEEYGEQLYF